MTDYKKLVEALRYCGNFTEREGCDESCEYFNDMDCPKRIMSDAAAAIEALNRLVDLNTQRCEELRKQLREAHESYERHLNELEAQLPKRGEWIETEEEEWGIYPFKKQTCSVCDCKIDHTFMLACMDYFDDRDTVFHYCPNCGAKMREVQE